jgi:hypothetical protein
MTHTSKTTGKYLHSDIVTHEEKSSWKLSDTVTHEEQMFWELPNTMPTITTQDYFRYSWQDEPSDNRSPFPHNNKTERV